ncbi:4'-phosphopantetheinyl transferase family protein [Oesophagostomum dentatum]|uniref:L-aminoadipate-semialdehyde dehydrogenase-phosphopantetheinyl transferase n=1 Tax=Oesophagostomum dentatum TaxID=61180 RepID=A0A0B1SM53_OESDE|nr:4'-phosphopantetheinyl transferase family protein [Oesophagostomum dentatum]
MRIDETRGRSAAEHIEQMAKLFTEGELRLMRNASSENEKWTAFYRIWCLKESVLKATGTGLVNDLRTLDFHTTEEKHVPGCFITSTTWSEKGVKQENWLFEESFVNDNHCVAVGRILSQDDDIALKRKQAQKARNLFSFMTFENLLEGSSVLNPAEDGAAADYAEYIAKPTKPW